MCRSIDRVSYPLLDLQNNNQLTMATREEVKGKGQAGEGGRDGGGKRV